MQALPHALRLPVMDLIAHFAFYHALPPFQDFSLVANDALYQEVPDDWLVVLTDIRGSTKAVQDGRYKEVNLVGAATISSYVNIIGTLDLPFVFGGDGATLLVPIAVSQLVLEDLARLKRLSQQEYGLELRIGYVAVGTLKARGCPVKVAKYELSPGNYLAQFKGGGLTLAEDMIKGNAPQAHLLTDAPVTGPAHLYGLSCRLNPLKSTRGQVLTILCKPLHETPEHPILPVLLEQLTAILNDDLRSATPVRPENVSWPVFPRKFSLEARLKSFSSIFVVNWIVNYVWALVSNRVLAWGIATKKFDAEQYKVKQKLNSDFKKYDETLRMVLDCTPAQIEAIQQLLADYQQRGRIIYGTHLSSEALMTCVVPSASTDHHVHFIDGAMGGYTLAATQLKAQAKALKHAA